MHESIVPSPIRLPAFVGRGLRLAAALLLAAPLVATAAVDPNVIATVTPLPTEVTLSRAASATQDELNVYAAYEVRINNSTTNDLNRVVFAGDATVNIDSIVVTSPSFDPHCTFTAAHVNCDIVQLKPGDVTTFAVVVKAPIAGTSIDFAWTFAGSEGKGGGNGCCTATGTASTTLIDSLSASGATHVQSFLKANDSKTFFTGANGVANSNDPWRTNVVVPGFTSLSYTTGSIDELTLAESCSPDLLACFSSTLSIPGLSLPSSDGVIAITLNRDVSTIKPGAKIANAHIFYSNPTHPDPNVSYPLDVPSCSLNSAGNVLPRPGVPCIDSRNEFSKKNNLSFPDSWGDWQFIIKAKDNGSYRG
jgi:hypothetical protein